MKKSHAKKPSKSKRGKSKGLVKVVNRFEDSYTAWGDRSWLPAAVQEARQDADQSTRLELVRRSRYWAQNSSLAIDLGNIFSQYVVGSRGLQIIPSYAASTPVADKEAEDWDETAARWWKQWSRFPCVDMQLPLAGIQDMMARRWWHDGEIFIYKTFSRESGRPRIQLIEGHRIGTPPDMRSEEGHSIVDGIQFRPDADGRPSGRPLVYHLRTDVGNTNSYGSLLPSLANSAGTWKPILAEQMIHLVWPDRPGSFRGLPMMTGRYNDLHDLEDLQMLEKKAAKDAAKITNVATTKTGEANTSASRRQRWQIQSQDAAGNAVTKQAPLFYETTMGGETVYQMIGEKFEQFKSERPSVATKDYWDYLVRKIAGPMHVLVLPARTQGTQFRAMLEVANSFFRMRSTVMAAAMREIYSWALGWGVQYDRALDGAPREWWHCDIVGARQVTADVGRQSAAVLAELKGGTRTYRDVCGELGYDWRAVLRQKAVEAQFVNRLVDEYKVPPSKIAELASESLRRTEETQETATERDFETPDSPNTTTKEEDSPKPADVSR